MPKIKVRVWCTARKSRIALLVIFLCACVYNFVRFFEYKMVSVGNHTLYEKNLRDPEAHRLEFGWFFNTGFCRVYYIGYYTILFILTHFLIPFTLMAVMNAHVIIVMWQGRRMRQTMTRQVGSFFALINFLALSSFGLSKISFLLVSTCHFVHYHILKIRITVQIRQHKAKRVDLLNSEFIQSRRQW